MKKTFLKSVVATAVVAAALAFSSVAAFASTQSYVFGDIETSNKAFSTFSYSDGGEIVKGVNYSGGTADWISDTSKGGPGVKLGGQSKNATSNARVFTITADKGDKITVTFCAQSSSATGADCVIANAMTGMVGDGTAEDGVYAEAFADGYTESTVSLTAKEDGTFYIGSPKLKSIIKAIEVEETNSDYDTSKFGAETTDKTAVVPATTPTTVLNADVITDAEFTAKSTDDDGNVTAYNDFTITNGAKYGDFTFTTSDSTKSISLSKSGVFKLAGAKNPVIFDAPANSVIKVTGIVSASATENADRTLVIGTSTKNALSDAVLAPLASEGTETLTYTTESAGTYYLYSQKSGINFETIEIYSATDVTAPYVTLTRASVDGKVAYKGVINGDADDSLVVTGIKVVTAKGKGDASVAPDAKSHTISAVAQDGSDYAFLVTIDEEKANDTGFEIQASVEYDNNGTTATSYSAVDEYDVVG
jgi:hypothetical protein